jgi:hypothetical protein
MNGRFRDSRHLVRAAALFVAGILAFLVARAVLVPRDFGTLGHFREGALRDNRDRSLAFAGRAACGECHSDIVEARKGSKHAGIGCEACHGAQAAHAGAADPSATKPALPDGKTICLVCHLTNVAKPKAFPQVDPKDHGDGRACDGCHKPHHPELT